MKQTKTLKKSITCILLACLLITSVACANTGTQSTQTGGLEKYTDVFYDTFDTVISVIAYCSSQNEFDALTEIIRDDYERYNKLFDIYNSYEGVNNIYTINKSAGESAVSVDTEIIGLLKLGAELYDETNGKVNIAMGSVLRIWHDARSYAEDHPDDAYVPEISELQSASLHCDINDVVISETDSTVYLLDPDMSLDVGAIAKGYATELVAEKLEAMGLTNIAINAGGNIRAIGGKPDADWVIGIQNPDKDADSSYVKKVRVNDISVVTSGVYERNFEAGGVTYHHIIDPDTLFPENRFQSVSVLTKNSGYADAFSTALFNMDIEEGKAFAESHDLDIMWILNDFSIVMTDGFESHIED